MRGKKYCLDCVYFEKTYKTKESKTGECVRFPPQIIPDKNLMGVEPVSFFPEVRAYSWCGEYKDASA